MRLPDRWCMGVGTLGLYAWTSRLLGSADLIGTDVDEISNCLARDLKNLYVILIVYVCSCFLLKIGSLLLHYRFLRMDPENQLLILNSCGAGVRVCGCQRRYTTPEQQRNKD